MSIWRNNPLTVSNVLISWVHKSLFKSTTHFHDTLSIKKTMIKSNYVILIEWLLTCTTNSLHNADSDKATLSNHFHHTASNPKAFFSISGNGNKKCFARSWYSKTFAEHNDFAFAVFSSLFCFFFRKSWVNPIRSEHNDKLTQINLFF